MHHLYSDKKKNEENKELFLYESIKWISVIFDLKDEELEPICDNLMVDDSEIDFEFLSNPTWNFKYSVSYRVSYEEDGRDNRGYSNSVFNQSRGKILLCHCGGFDHADKPDCVYYVYIGSGHYII